MGKLCLNLILIVTLAVTATLMAQSKMRKFKEITFRRSHLKPPLVEKITVIKAVKVRTTHRRSKIIKCCGRNSCTEGLKTTSIKRKPGFHSEQPASFGNVTKLFSQKSEADGDQGITPSLIAGDSVTGVDKNVNGQASQNEDTVGPAIIPDNSGSASGISVADNAPDMVSGDIVTSSQNALTEDGLSSEKTQTSGIVGSTENSAVISSGLISSESTHGEITLIVSGSTSTLKSTLSISNPSSTTMAAGTGASATETTPSTNSLHSSSTTTTSAPTTMLTDTSTTSTTPLPIVINCTVGPKNASLFTVDGTLIATPKYGDWEVLCGHHILFGSGLVDWETNLKQCHSIGMTPLIIENDAKRSCLNNWNTKAWRRRRGYWTAVNRVEQSSYFTWCNNSTPVNFPLKSPYWAGGAPNLTESNACVHGTLMRNGTTFSLFNAPCNKRFLWSCQGPMPSAPCSQCPIVSTARNPKLFTNIDKESYRSIKDPSAHGLWYTINGRQYMFSKTLKTWQDSLTYCYSLGMKLLNIEFDTKATSIVKAMNSPSLANTKPVPGLHWTSGMHFNCLNATRWCSINKHAIKPQWAPGEPTMGAQNCIAVDATTTSALLTDQDCAKTLNFICEIRDTTNHSDKSMALVNECALTYNISQAKVDEIINTGALDVTGFSMELKCFMKCLGEQGGIFWNGKLIDDSVISYIEMMGGDYETRGKVVVTKCGETQQMDECEAAAAIIKCGIETDAEVTKHLITTYSLHPDMEQSPSITNLPICPNYECVIDHEKRGYYLNNLSGPGYVDGIFVTACGIKYFVGYVMMTYREAGSYCCQMGLQPVSLETALEHKCLSQGMNPRRLEISVAMDSFVFTWTSASLPMNPLGAPVWCSSNKPMNMYWSYKYPDRTPTTYGGTQVCHISDEAVASMNLRSAEDTETQRFYVVCEERIY